VRLLVEKIASPIGAVLITHDGNVLCNVEFADSAERRRQELAQHFPNTAIEPARDHSNLSAAIARYFDGEVTSIDDLPVAGIGTPFQQECWAALRIIAPGSTRSYGEQARALDKPHAARAVGRANASNPFAIVVPCHRLCGANGDLTGYGGGLERKRWLLDHEARHARVGARPRTGVSAASS